MMKQKRSLSSKIILALVLLFFYAPILYIIIFSFNSSRSLTKFTGFSLRWYQKMFGDPTMMESVVYTILIAVLATLISTIVGTLTAIGLSKSRKALQRAVEQINDLPVMNPDIVTAISLLMFFSALAVNKGFVTLLLAHIMFCIPYVMLSVTPKLRSLDPNLTDAALDLGATPLQALWKVIVPQIWPGILSGALIAFTMSFDDFVISYFVTGNGVQNISILVYTMSKRVNPSINALSTLVIVLIAFALTVVNLVPFLRGRRKKRSAGREASPEAKKRLRIAYTAVAGAVILGMIGLFIGSAVAQNNKRRAAAARYGSSTLKLYITGEYLGENVISDFEKQFGVKVIIEYFDSNEMMYAKMQAGDSYDVVIPSEYMIQRMMANDMLQELDLSRIPNLENLADEVKNLSFDPDNRYSVPYFWGSVGIVYDHTVVDPKDVEEQGYEVLRNPKYKGNLYLYDSERDSFMMALKALGYSMNTDNEQELYEAYDWLLELNRTMDPVYVTDEVIDAMMTGTKALAVVYSGDGAVILDENENMSFSMPKEGTNIWYDCMVIPKNAENPLLAHEFINYMLSYEACYDNAETVGYASPNKQVLADMTEEGGLYAENEAYYPRFDPSVDEVFSDNQTIKRILSELWIKVKAS